MRFKSSLLCAVVLSVFGSAMADDSDVEYFTSGFAYFQLGQMMHVSPATDIEKPLEQKFHGRFTLGAKINTQLKIIVGAEAKIEANVNDNGMITGIDLKEAQGVYSFGDPENSWLEVASGYLPFKYNPDARNLGEYLFRTGTYPGYIRTDFDNAKARVLGFRVSSTLYDNLKMHMLFTSAYEYLPLFDYSLTFVTSYSLLEKMVDIGAGVDFNRLLPIDPKRTTKEINIAYDENNNPVINKNGDTLRYTLKGTKVMVRASFDPKPLLPFADIMGNEDGKVYAEIIAIGLKNYGAYYNDIFKRMPVMFGVNIPTFNIMDILALEFEYYGSDKKYKLDIKRDENPTPENWSEADGERTPWKISLFLQKTITKGLAFKALFARDHYRPLNPNGGTYDAIERMNTKDDWHYKLRIMYSF